MKKNYIVPTMLESAVAPVSILMSSGSRSVDSNLNIHGGSNSGNAAAAF
ncbi:MAG: hypothetical protein IJQ84_08745 [Paludibacteraceae bacterium]|nr:hypothetical protein [Paludibacteraceae bacterium]